MIPLLLGAQMEQVPTITERVVALTRELGLTEDQAEAVDAAMRDLIRDCMRIADGDCQVCGLALTEDPYIAACETCVDRADDSMESSCASSRIQELLEEQIVGSSQ